MITIIYEIYFILSDIYVYSDGSLKISGFYFFEVLPSKDAKSKLKRKLFYSCPSFEMNSIDLKYDNWFFNF